MISIKVTSKKRFLVYYLHETQEDMTRSAKSSTTYGTDLDGHVRYTHAQETTLHF